MVGIARVLLAGVAVLTWIEPVPARAPVVGAHVGASVSARGAEEQEEVDVLAGRLARAWEQADVEALTRWMADDGLSLDLGEQAHPALGLRQARTALAEFLESGGPGTVRTVRAEVLGGGRPKALVELAWSPAPGNVPSRAGYSVFIGLERRAEGWRATEIRVIR